MSPHRSALVQRREPTVPRRRLSVRRHARVVAAHRRPAPAATIHAMTVDLPGRLRLTVLGCSTAVPHPMRPPRATSSNGTDDRDPPRRRPGRRPPARSACSIRASSRRSSSATCTPTTTSTSPACATSTRGPSAAPAPAGPPAARRARPARCPGVAISERPTFFDDAFDDRRVRRRRRRSEIGALTRPLRAAASTTSRPGACPSRRPTGPASCTPATPARATRWSTFARGADLLLVEAALRSTADDDPERGHLTAEEAIDLAPPAEARAALLVHYDPARRADLEALCDATGPWIRPAVAGLIRDRLAAAGGGAARARRSVPAALARSAGLAAAAIAAPAASRNRAAAAGSVARSAAVRQNPAASAAAPIASADVGGLVEQRDGPGRVAGGRAVDGDRRDRHRSPAAPRAVREPGVEPAAARPPGARRTPRRGPAGG